MWVGFLATWKGAEVYPNLNKTGPADLMIKVDGVIYAIDVKTDCWDHQGNRWKPANTYKVKDPVFPVAVTPEGDICDWKVRWIRNRAPEGLENFWSKDTAINSTKQHEATPAQAARRCRLLLLSRSKRG